MDARWLELPAGDAERDRQHRATEERTIVTREATHGDTGGVQPEPENARVRHLHRELKAGIDRGFEGLIAELRVRGDLDLLIVLPRHDPHGGVAFRARLGDAHHLGLDAGKIATQELHDDGVGEGVADAALPSSSTPTTSLVS